MTNSPATVSDWTRAGGGIAYQACRACHATWYFRRGFCPRCGVVDPDLRQAGGSGTVYALTLVSRAPSEELRAHAPYLIVLVDTDEGFRLMAHGDSSLQIGDRVRARFREFGGKQIPYFERF